jgi:hypothetical protein
LIDQQPKEEIEMSSITYEVTVNEWHTEWKLNGKTHREDGPAIECVDGTKSWWIGGDFHREDGPAIEWANGAKSWYLNGVGMTEEEHRAQTQPAVEMTIAEIEKLLGKRVKVIK